MDVVDNIWVALWFAVHTAYGGGKGLLYSLHFEERKQETGSDTKAYIILLQSDINKSETPGCWFGATTELVDLRIACPSIFLRPHAQHGLVLRKRPTGDGCQSPVDYNDLVVGVISIGLRDALDWIGLSKTLSTHTLFPSPHHDKGYDIILNRIPFPQYQQRKLIGSPFMVGP